MKNEDWQKLKSMELDDWLSLVSEDDDLGITKVKAKAKAPTADEHLVAKFQEINDFFRTNQRLPENNMTNISELMLFKRLESIRGNDKQCHALVDFDEFNLLPLTHEVAEVAEPKAQYKPEPKVINSIDDIFDDDDFGLLGEAEDSIFNMKHVKSGPRAESDFVARRKSCKDFDKYKDLFPVVQQELNSGKRKIVEFDDKGEKLLEGQFYVLSGVLMYLESISFSSEEKTVDGKRFRKDGRTRCIFENGTESNMLYRSLAKSLYADGKIVTPVGNHFAEVKTINDDDQSAGFIYVLSSESEDPRIKSIPNLFKIGYATTPVAKRIANASKEPTYLMAPVNVVAEYECYNMNTQKFENLIHTVFKDVCLDIEVADLSGNMCKPREWFSVPIKQVNTAIELIVNGQIVNYRYNSKTKKIELR
ncbi:GIY-YIG nuclease family protein [Pseudoalteromonas sp. Cn5-37]|uniref:GIY-YIG nuclease family protein n=1 Tax=Pseudoalteromonas sp. Cn5-37 TaxID=2908886 RepID=UPI001F30442D|nr:GIY-YIG nuclease family protein [Pseudoalteromonas sp. Cn5-37]MCF2918575.1 GIY-YIG nuclease family protein [Pseudoalteromonas sp. Cn5-37]